ncbi:MAG TPA: type I-E CRISPR-associated protein Cas7/Cse4/CasC [Candidatus Deferrimicrobiaceae bacterium]|jgi:CRISPR system Cascade subunit CasC
MKKLVEIHILQNYAPSNLNRDDTGAPKDAIFGGSRRARISSQCLKRAVRQHFYGLVSEGRLIAKADMAERTKRVMDALLEELDRKGHTDKEITENKIRLALEVVGLPVSEDGKNEVLLFLGKKEIGQLAEIIEAKWDELDADNGAEFEVPEGKKKGKGKKEKGENPKLKEEILKVFDGGKAIDLALFGRMLANMPQKNQDASCQVAHAISTHAVEREFDFYTAVDERKPEDTAGADMMGTIEFNSACFYRYAVVDFDKLQSNLGDKEVDGLAEKGLRAFVEGFVISEPTGKQNTFAAHNPPEFVAVTIRKNGAPRNLANAFENAIRARKDESLTRVSADRLVQKGNSLKGVYGGEEQTFVLNPVGAEIKEFGTETVSLGNLIERTIEAVRG